MHDLTTFRAVDIQKMSWEYFSRVPGFADAAQAHPRLRAQMRSITSGWWQLAGDFWVMVSLRPVL